MTYFTRTIRRVTAKLIQTVVNPKVLQQKRKIDNNKIQQYLAEFFDMILVKIDGYLSTDDDCYVTGANISIVDIMLFCEIETVSLMYRREIPANLVKLNTWYEKLAAEESL